ncbi:Protein tilB [Chytridiales sp. JEL 0842]|nr:Protein tilB [Chytridiales sp. JEL 0842]
MDSAKGKHKINQELLRKRSEHNDGELSTLREVALHQFDIEKIENLDVYCRHLEILYLQNNQISKIENLNKLKELQYLNLALNNITVLENLQGCESLTKLDLTVNFIDNLLDVESLKGNELLRELFLVGNPCTQVEGYRDFVITTLPQLKFLDGKEIEKSERIKAAQVYPAIRERLVKNAAEKRSQSSTNETPKENTEEDSRDDIEKLKDEFNNKTFPHTPETRLEAANDIEKMNKPVTKEDKQPKKDPLAITYGPDGRVLQRNQGKWEFCFHETPESVVLEVALSKFLDSSLIDVDVHPTFIRVIIKGKLLQLTLDEEVSAEQVYCERSRLSGHLCVTMIKASHAGQVADVEEVVKARKEASTRFATIGAKQKTESTAVKNRRMERLLGDDDGGITVLRAPQPGVAKKAVPKGIVESKVLPTDMIVDDGFIDDADVPPLC